ncbi:MAPEG family protein [Hyphobacterium sp.]|uniref:MAPEG family protein n=1 Tax=Hyphobacterium sp. TaxID=2004662 RepID=UPI003B529C4C
MTVPVISADLWALLAAIVLGIAHLSMSSILSLKALGPSYILGNREQPRTPDGLAGRIARAYGNWLENFAQFAAAVFLVHAAGEASDLAGWGAWIFVIGRQAYVAAYAFAPAGIRPACWMAAQIGVLVILSDLFF